METRDIQFIEALLTRESEMGGRMCSFDWTATSVGDPSTWPQTLQFALGICLNSKFPMFVRWGTELVQFYNDAYIPILGYKHPQALGRPAREVWPEIWHDLEPQLNAVLYQGEATWNERVLLKLERNGFVEDAWVTWSYSPIPDGNGGIGGVFCACTEETPRIKAEAERDILAEQRRLALRSARLGWWHLDLGSRQVTGDERFQSIFGVQQSRLSFEEVIGLIHEDDWQHVVHTVRPALDPHNAHSFAVQARIRRPSGQVRWVAFQGELSFFDEDNLKSEASQQRPTSFVGTVADITESKEAEAALRASEEQKGAILASSLDAIVSVNARGCIAEFNPAAEKTFGYTKTEALGAPFCQLMVPLALRRKHYRELRRYLRTGHGTFLNRRVEATALRADGHEFPVEVAITRIALDGPPSFSAYVRDITEQKRGEEERATLLQNEQLARQQAEEANRIKDEFLATLSHELRTPLQAVLGWTQLLASGQLESHDSQRAIEIIERSARAQIRLVEDLLDISRIITGKLRLEVQPVDLVEVIHAAVEAVSPAAQAKDIRLQMLIDSRTSFVSGDANRLQQVVWNLLTNAVKFTPQGGRVQVSLERVQSFIEVAVSDTGQGIAPDFLPHIFDRFRQADQTSTRGHGGLGLGLSIVNQVIQLHGGTIKVSSDGLGQGAKFVVRLPQMVSRSGNAADTVQWKGLGATKNSAASRESNVCPPQLNDLLVLLVDDEVDSRILLQVVLEGCGAKVVTASSAEEALVQRQKLSPDVLVSDIGMPGRDGYELIQQVRAWEAQNGGWVPAVALTAYARAEDRIKALRAGFQVHLAKPVEPHEFLAVVASLAERPGAHDWPQPEW